jgi:hypothetical protein
VSAVLKQVSFRFAHQIELLKFQPVTQIIVNALWFVIFAVQVEPNYCCFAGINSVFVPRSFLIQTAFSRPVAIHAAKVKTAELNVEIKHWWLQDHVQWFDSERTSLKFSPSAVISTVYSCCSF